MSEERSATIVDKRLGERVRARRLQLDISQERLADLLGVTFQQVQKYEKGTNRMAASRLLDIANALDIPVAYFFEGMDRRKRFDIDSLEGAVQMPGAAELIRMFASTGNAGTRRRVLETVRSMLAETT
jgi:transcriptional regulator with XRE-family HTH domain